MVASKFALIFSVVILYYQHIFVSASGKVSCCIDKSCWMANKDSQLEIESNCMCVSKPVGKMGNCGAQEILVSTKDDDALSRDKRDVNDANTISNAWFQRVSNLICFTTFINVLCLYRCQLIIANLIQKSRIDFVNIF